MELNDENYERIFDLKNFKIQKNTEKYRKDGLL